MATSTWVADMEAAARTAAAALVAQCELIQRTIGERELGLPDADVLTAIAAYLSWRDKPDEWLAYIQQVARAQARAGGAAGGDGGDAGSAAPPPTEYHLRVALHIAIREATAMERRIARRGGFWSVVQQIVQRQLHTAVQDARAAEQAQAALEQITVLPPYPVVDLAAVVQQQVAAALMDRAAADETAAELGEIGELGELGANGANGAKAG